jgi:Spy/CpxP family protein refolding chaperone
MVFCLAALGASALVACGGTVEHSPQTSASAATKAPVGSNTHGVVKVMGDALSEVPLRPEQRTEIEKLASDAEARHAPMAGARKELMIAFADQVEKGSIDKAALQAKADQAMAGFDKVRADDRAAFVRLHDILDSEQRNAFVDALEKQMKGKHGEMKHGGHHGGPGAFGPLKELSDELKLSDDQRSKIHELVGESMKEARKDGPKHGFRGAPHGGGKHALEAFREDKLDLDKVAPPQDGKEMARFGTDHMTKFAEKVLPVLTSDQRTIAANKIRQFANNGDASLLGH